MTVAKGKIQPDKSYVYTCGNCHGMGYVGNAYNMKQQPQTELCSHCYNGNYARITEAMRHARGQRYYALLKAALSVAGKPIADKMQALKAEHGKVTVVMLGYLCHHFNINFKALGEWLEECQLVPSGMTRHVQESDYVFPDGSKSRFKVSILLERGGAWYYETYGKEWDKWEGLGYE